MITLLNGENLNKKELIPKMDNDNYYYGHLGQHALSSSALKQILQSPKTYRNILKYGQRETPALILGKLIHWAILEPHKLEPLHIVKASTTGTNIYKDAVKKYGVENVVLEKDKKMIDRLSDAILRNEAALELLQGAEFEVPEIKMIDNLPFRGKADILKENHIIDLKSSSSLETFKYSADKYGYDLQAYIYMNLFKCSRVSFLVIDKLSTDIAIYETSEEFIERGKKKFETAVGLYKHFFIEGNDLDQYVMRAIL